MHLQTRCPSEEIPSFSSREGNKFGQIVLKWRPFETECPIPDWALDPGLGWNERNKA